MSARSDLFVLKIGAFVRKAKGNLNAVGRKVVLDLGTRVILRSPVKTGRFRANWQYGESARPRGVLIDVDKNGTATIRKLTGAVGPEAMGKVHWLTNNLPYARRLEDGWSKQAPIGMVGVTVVEYQAIVRDAAREINR